MVVNSSRTGLKLENTNLLHSSPLVEFLKLFTMDDFITKMAEQTNFYAVQRGAPRSFKPVSDGVIIINVHVIIYYWKGQPFFYLKQFFSLFYST